MRRSNIRRQRVLTWLVATSLLALTACGSDRPAAQAPPGSPENPLEAKPSSLEGTTSETSRRPSFAELVDDQTNGTAGRDSSNPCALVTKAEAKAIMRADLLDPLVAPQGPTCIYRDRARQSYATLAFQPRSIDVLRRQLRRAQRIEVGGRTGYCGMHGQPMLYLAAGRDRVLSVAAPCPIAARFARHAMKRLDG